MKYLLALFIPGLVSSCGSKETIPDVSQIKISPALIRFEQEFFALDTSVLEVELDSLQRKYPDFSDIYLNEILHSSPQDRTKEVKQFLGNPFIQSLRDTCRAVFPDFERHYVQLAEALTFYKYYFPNDTVPDIYTCITGFEVGSFTIGEQILGISLDFYLGDQYNGYHPDIFPSYIQIFMTPEYLTSRTIHALITNKLGNVQGNRLLDYMIHQGKELYVKRLLLPKASDSQIFEYTNTQLEWLTANEAQIWGHLIEENLLYNTNYREFQKLVSPSPNVPNMPPDAPGRLGNWIGARIVENYHKRHPDLTLESLLLIDDTQEILTESKYKPRQ